MRHEGRAALPDGPHRRRRRRPTLWDVQDPPFGIPIPPPHTAAGAPSAVKPPPTFTDLFPLRGPGPTPGPADVVRAPHPGEVGWLAGIDIAALRALLSGSVPPATPVVPPPAPVNDDPTGASSAPSTTTPSSDITGGNMQATRHARRLYVGNLPPETTDVQIGDFFNRALVAAHGSESGDEPVISVYINLDKRFAFIETRTVREAAAGLMLDGVKFREMFLRVRRPNDFHVGSLGATASIRPPDGFDPTVLGIVSTQVSDGPNKMFVGGLPYSLTEDQIKTLLSTYGQLAAFNLIKEPNSGMSKGFAFFEYVDGSVVEAACKGLHGMKVGDKTLTVRRATHTSGGTGATFASGLARPNGNATTTGTMTSNVANTGLTSSDVMGTTPTNTLVRNVTRVVCLEDAITADDLDDDTDYSEIVEDVEDEARKFGFLEEVVIPRRADGERLAAGIGRIFLRYAKPNDADRAQMTFAGRRFGERTVVSSFFDEERFAQRSF